MNVSVRQLFFIAMSSIVTACTGASDGVGSKWAEPDVRVEGGKFTPEILWQMGAVGAPVVSPDGETILFTISYTDISADKTTSEVYAARVDGSGPIVKMTSGGGLSAHDPAFTPTGKIAFLRAADKGGGEAHLCVAEANGSRVRTLTAEDNGEDAFLFAPDGRHVALIRTVKVDKDLHDLYPDLPKANAKMETDLMYRHWNQWEDGSYSHIFIATIEDGAVVAEADIMDGERHHSPMRPYGGIEQLAWSADGTKLAYTCKKLEGKAAATSTNSDIYVYDLSTGETANVSAPNAGYDTNPAFAADGSLFWLSMEHDGYESDRNRIMRKDLATGQLTDLTEGSELYVQQMCLAPNGRELWFIADENARDAIFHLDVESKAITRLTNDTADYTSLALAKGGLVASRTSMFCPPDIFFVSTADGSARNITNANAQTLAKLKMGSAEERWITTTDGKKMLTWVILPPDFDSAKKYPALLYCQGGPQSTVSQFWSRRWNFALMAANGYVVVAPNRRGLPGFGVEWNEQISKDYGGQNMKDYLTAIDSLAAEPYVDAEHLGCVGASYGGFSVYWLAGHHEGRFKAFLAHCGIFNLEQLYSTTEELFFVNWDLGGPYWDKDNAVAQNSFAQSPHLFVGKWDTPIMVVHGEKDFRIPYTQGMGAFNVAKMRGLDAEFLYFPEECHWVQRPQNSILWHREFYRWLDRWLK